MRLFESQSCKRAFTTRVEFPQHAIDWKKEAPLTLQKTKTEHPYVTVNPKICNGSPVISGTRTRIVDVAIEYEYLNHTPDEIIKAHPHLKLEQIHDALSYYYENRAELDKKIQEDKQLIQKFCNSKQ
ncbi:MAG TPA: DUF433 domain-containing protein [Candidatus Bathyarchaeia archaeon]|nr:DUF433 domain-containing protein [Candidatus Bathyarchaeia archaeon]